MNLLQTEPASTPKLSAEGFQSLYEHAPLAMLIGDAEGFAADANTRARQLFGDDLAGKPIADLLGISHAPEALVPVRGELRGSEGETRTVTVLSAPIALGIDEASLVSVWPEDEAVGTDRHDHSAPHSPDHEFATLRHGCRRLAHILNDRLTVIQGFTSLAKEDIRSGVAYRQHLNQISDAVDASAELARRLLEFGSPPEATMSRVDINGLVDSITEGLQQAAKGDLSIKLGEDVPTIESDAELIVEMLHQLAENPPAATAPEQRRELRTRYVGEPGEVRIQVLYRGAEISREDSAAVFEPFFAQEKDSDTIGLGLAFVRSSMMALGGRVELDTGSDDGISVVLSFPAEASAAAPASVESEEDEIEAVEALPDEPEAEVLPAGEPDAQELEPQPAVEQSQLVLDLSRPTSEENCAQATAEVDLPALAENLEQLESASDTTNAAKGEDQPAPAAPVRPRGGKETILVVEDEEMVRDLVTRSLGYLGYEVISACNGEEGLSVARRRNEEIDMVFTDIVMPRMSGPEMVAKMGEEGLGLPVLFTTGFTDNKRLLDGGEIREGVNLLPKPYTTKVLATRIREVLDGIEG